MGDHIAAAQRYRARAAKCELFAENTSSMGFGEGYRLLAREYLVLANLEEDCARRPSPFARQEHQKEQPKPADQPQARPVFRAHVCGAAVANDRRLYGDRFDAADVVRINAGGGIRP